ncbi:hypothetical protein [Aquimarina sp. AU119]|uniref:hypothetical protein n=1 Tax=Aquimarina sp. AU119 TaxID=2108528 RepID=UPI000D6995E0|nr:hypothetical protein [Aquimarina sp. AU119]
MKKRISFHHKSTVLNCFFAIAILFSFGGYSNYSSPKIKETTIESIVIPKRISKNIVSFQPSTSQKKNVVFSYIPHKNLRMLSLFHSRISLTKDKKQRSFIPLFYKQKIIRIPFHSSTVSEEEPFHFNLITG